MQLLREKIIFIIGVIVVAILILYTAICCTAMQQQMLKDGFVSLGDCAILSSLGCASQSMGGCPPPLTSWNGDEWGNYGECLGEKSMACTTSALAKCAYRSIVDAIDGPVVTGGVGCSGPQEQNEILACIRDGEYETEAEAVTAVAACQRLICLNLED